MPKAIIFDTETTGKNDPIVIEAAWLELNTINPFETGSSFNQRYNPGKAIELGALATHHILDEELSQCPPASDFQLPNDTEYIIAHNADYDWTVIGSPKVKRICTLALARRAWPHLDSHKLSALLYYVDRPHARELLKNAHSALYDVKICATVLKHICSLLLIETIEALWEISEIARIPTHMTFGKHKGTAITDIPKDYKTWLLHQDNIDPYLKQALS